MVKAAPSCLHVTCRIASDRTGCALSLHDLELHRLSIPGNVYQIQQDGKYEYRTPIALLKARRTIRNVTCHSTVQR